MIAATRMRFSNSSSRHAKIVGPLTQEFPILSGVNVVTELVLLWRKGFHLRECP